MKHSKKDVPADKKSAQEEAAQSVPATEAKEGKATVQAEIPAEGTTVNDAVPAEECESDSVPAEECEEMARLADDLAKAQGELQKTKEAYLRAVAEFDNYRRRNNEEKPKLANFAKGDLAKDLFPILDNFKLGLDAAEKQHPEAKSITEGFAMIASQLKSALARHNIVEINPGVGASFNPNEHESLTSQPSADVPEDAVLFVHRVGYKIGDRLLRPASVVISSGAGTQEAK